MSFGSTSTVQSPQVLKGQLISETSGEGSELITFKANETGSSGRTIFDRLSEALTPKDFGAVGDGVSDDTTAVQAWLDTTNKNLKGSPGTYLITTKLTSAVAGRYISGNGMKLLTGASLNNTLLELNASNQVVEFFEFEANATAQCTGIFIGAYDNCEIRFNKFSNFDGSAGTDTGSGIVCNSLGSDHHIHHNRLIDCHYAHLADQYGSILCNAGGSIIEYNIITDCQQTGISVAGGSSGNAHHIQILNNTMVGKTAATDSGGVNVDGYTVGAVISGNNIRNMAVEGILVAGSVGAYGTATSDVTITNNTLHECVLNEFALQGSALGDIQRVLIAGNKVYRSTNTNQSIVCTYADHVDVFNNLIYGHDIAYTVTATSRYHNVSNNTFINQDNVAIAAFAQKSAYTNNRIYGDGVSTKGITFNAVTTAGYIKIANNTISNCDIGINGTFNASLPVYVQNNFLLDNTTDLSYTGELANSSEGNRTDATLYGEFTLSSGTASITNSNVLAADKIKLTMKTPSSAGSVEITSKTGGSGFGVTSTNGSDASTYYYVIDR